MAPSIFRQHDTVRSHHCASSTKATSSGSNISSNGSSSSNGNKQQYSLDDDSSVASTVASASWLPSFMSWDCDDDDCAAEGPLIMAGSASAAIEASSSHSYSYSHDDASENDSHHATHHHHRQHQQHCSSSSADHSSAYKRQSMISPTLQKQYFSAGTSRTPPISPLPFSKPKRSKLDCELKTAHHALVGSIKALLNLLQQSGIPKPSVDELQRNLDMERFFAVLKRCQDYLHCLVLQTIATKSNNKENQAQAYDSNTNSSNNSKSNNKNNNDEDDKDANTIVASIHLLVCTWESLCRYKRIQYRIAYKRCFALRHKSQKQRDESKVQKTIAMQVQLAEQFTACQKKYLLAQKWEKAAQRKLNVKPQQLVPHGYQAIRCLQ